MAVEMVTIVDLADQVVESRERPEIRKFGLTYRVTYVLVFNSAGQVLIQRRTDIKDWCPGRYDFAAGGIIQFDESYNLSAERELEEELGIRPALKPEFALFYDDIVAPVNNRNWGWVYSCQHEGPFNLQPEEVADATVVSVEEALALPQEQVTPDTRQVLTAYLL